MEVKEVGKSVKKNLASLLSGKPIWAFWIAYCVLTGIMFGIFYTAMYLVALKWWIPVIVVLLIGIIWGTVIHADSTDKPEEKKEPQQEEKPL